MVGRSIFQFLQVVVLARFLKPEDFGLIALVIAVIAFVQIFSDMGISNAIIHKQQISHEVLSSLYWLNVLTGTLLMALLALLAPLISVFFHSPQLQPLLILISAYFLISSLGQQLSVVAEKNLSFAPLAINELIASFCGFMALLLVSWMGGGVYAIAAAMLIGAAVTTVLAWARLADGWRPLMRINLRETRPFLCFGGYMMGQNLLNTLNVHADILIGGRVLAPAQLGLYSLPRDVSLKMAGVINPIATRVGLPLMAKMQHDQLYLRMTYLKIMRMTASINFPIYMALALFAPEVVFLLFGGKWSEAAPLLRVLAIWGMLRSIGNPAGSLVFAVGRVDLAFRWNLALVFIVMPALWFGAKFGAMGMAFANLMIMAAYLLPAWLFLIRPLCGAGLQEYFQQLLVPLLASFISAVVALAVTSQITDAALRLGLGIVSGCIAYIFISRWINTQWFDAMRELLLRK